MNLENQYWVFDKALPERYCDHLIKYGNQQKESLALTGGLSKKADNGEELNDEEIKNLKKKRDSNIVWLEDKWIYRLIHPYIHVANKNAGWNFQWDFSEACQFTKYKLNQYYDWHCDSWEKAYENDNKNVNYRNKIRKLSVTCQLTDESEYVGGELEFQFRNKDDPTLTVEATESKKKGTIIVFPSHIWHRVKPVTSGNRYSLVIWSLGKPFI
jgi:PKHD-type hydroxylase